MIATHRREWIQADPVAEIAYTLVPACVPIIRRSAEIPVRQRVSSPVVREVTMILLEQHAQVFELPFRHPACAAAIAVAPEAVGPNSDRSTGAGNV